MRNDISVLREAIDRIDRELIELLEQRMDVAAAIAAVKAERNIPVTDRAREAEKLDTVRAMCRPETGPFLTGAFEAVMAASRAYQEKLLEDRHGG